MAITLADFTKIWASTSPLTPYPFTESNYKQGWNFIGGTPPSRQMWDYLQKNNDEKLLYIVKNFLPLSGGTMTGTITNTQSVLAKRDVDTANIVLYAGKDNTGSYIAAWGKNNSSSAGVIQLRCSDGTNVSGLLAYPDGSLTWGGVSLTDGSFLTTASVSVNASSGTTSYTITAPAVSGYQFICWYMSASNGNVYPTYIAASNTSSTKVWAVNPTNNTTIVCFALYVRKW